MLSIEGFRSVIATNKGVLISRLTDKDSVDAKLIEKSYIVLQPEKTVIRNRVSWSHVGIWFSFSAIHLIKDPTHQELLPYQWL